jgi:hypothetical protein
MLQIPLARAITCLLGVLGIFGTVFFLSSFGPALWTYLTIAPLLIVLAAIPPRRERSLSRTITMLVLIVLTVVDAVNIGMEGLRNVPPVYGVLAFVAIGVYWVAFLRHGGAARM